MYYQMTPSWSLTYDPTVSSRKTTRMRPLSGAKSAAVALIIIGAIALAAVLSLGIFLAIKPKTKVTKTFYWIGADIDNRTTTEETTTVRQPSKETSTVKMVETPTVGKIIEESSNAPKTEPPYLFNNIVEDDEVNEIQTTESTTVQSTTSTFPTTTIEVYKSRSGSPATPNRTPGVTIRMGQPMLVMNGHQLPVPQPTDSQATDEYPSPPLPETENSSLELVAERKMSKYGRIVGLSYKNGVLYVPSHRNGKISVLSTPDLNLIDELSCHKCSIYDLVVLDNGDIVVAQGKKKKLSKISLQTGAIEKEIRLAYSTKGIAVGQDGELFVLTRSHDKVYRYDSDLNEIDRIEFPNESLDDCNFLKVDTYSPLIYVSCENQVFVFDFAGNLLQKLKPGEVNKFSYSVGIAVDEDNALMVVRRGKEMIDMYSPDGVFRKSYGSNTDTLWSDLEVGNGHAFVVEYISSTVRAFRYQ